MNPRLLERIRDPERNTRSPYQHKRESRQVNEKTCPWGERRISNKTRASLCQALSCFTEWCFSNSRKAYPATPPEGVRDNTRSQSGGRSYVKQSSQQSNARPPLYAQHKSVQFSTQVYRKQSRARFTEEMVER